MKALKAVRAWLHRRQDISGLDMLKLWKARRFFVVADDE